MIKMIKTTIKKEEKEIPFEEEETICPCCREKVIAVEREKKGEGDISFRGECKYCGEVKELYTYETMGHNVFYQKYFIHNICYNCREQISKSQKIKEIMEKIGGAKVIGIELNNMDYLNSITLKKGNKLYKIYADGWDDIYIEFEELRR